MALSQGHMGLPLLDLALAKEGRHGPKADCRLFRSLGGIAGQTAALMCHRNYGAVIRSSDDIDTVQLVDEGYAYYRSDGLGHKCEHCECG